MDRRSFLKAASATGIAGGLPSAIVVEKVFAAEAAAAKKPATPTAPHGAVDSPNTILLKDYRPQSIYKIPTTQIAKAKYPIIDMHSHPYAKTDAEITTWLKHMDEAGVEKTMILTMATGKNSTASTQSIRSIPHASNSGAASTSPDTTSPASAQRL